jgi:hypothetical protein
MTTVVLNTVTRKVEVFSSARDVQARAEIADHKAAADPHPQYAFRYGAGRPDAELDRLQRRHQYKGGARGGNPAGFR